MTATTSAPITNERPTPPPGPISFETFLEWLDEDTWAEWVDGEISVISPASDEHQDLRDFLLTPLRLYTEAHDLGLVRGAPFLMRTAPRQSGREPDLLFVAAAHADRLQPTYLDGPADLAVEIVSPESTARDRGDKFVEYEAAGVNEYWLLDPLRQDALFYQLAADGRYHRADPDAAGVYHSAVLPGLALSVAWLWQRPLPPVLIAARQLGL
jgi:Uma2 family endonuclease